MGGGKKKKTISAAEKAQKKEEAKEVKKSEKKGVATTSLEIDESLLKRALSTIKSSDVITTYQLATALGVKMSVARRLVRELSNSGEVRIVDKFRSLYILTVSQ